MQLYSMFSLYSYMYSVLFKKDNYFFESVVEEAVGSLFLSKCSSVTL